MECLLLASSQGVSRRVEEKYNTVTRTTAWGFISKKCLHKAHENTKERKKGTQQ